MTTTHPAPRPAPLSAPAPTPSQRRVDGAPVVDGFETPDLTAAVRGYRFEASTLRTVVVGGPGRVRALRALRGLELDLRVRPDVLALLRREDALICAQRDRHGAPVRVTKRARCELRAVRCALEALTAADTVDRA